MPPKRRRLDDSIVTTSIGNGVENSEHDGHSDKKIGRTTGRTRKGHVAPTVITQTKAVKADVDFSLSPLFQALETSLDEIANEAGTYFRDFDLVADEQVADLLDGQQRYLDGRAEYNLQVCCI